MNNKTLTLAQKSRQIANDSVSGFVNEKFPKHRDEILERIKNNSEQGLVSLHYTFDIGPAEVQAGGRRLCERLQEYFASSDMGFQVHWNMEERGSMLECVLVFYW